MSRSFMARDKVRRSSVGTGWSGAWAGGSMVNWSVPASAEVSSMRASLSSAMAFSSASPVAGLPCHPPPWREGQPQPLTVVAMTAIGLAFGSVETSAKRSKADLIWSGAWPSIETTSKPKAANLAAMVSGDCWLETRSAWPYWLQLMMVQILESL